MICMSCCVILQRRNWKNQANPRKFLRAMRLILLKLWMNSGSKRKDISSMRRNLQREYLRRVAEAVAKPAATQPADARALKREAAVQLQADIRKAVANPKLSKEARAHLNESQNTLNEALKAMDPRKANVRHFEMRALVEQVATMWEPYADIASGRRDRGR